MDKVMVLVVGTLISIIIEAGEGLVRASHSVNYVLGLDTWC